MIDNGTQWAEEHEITDIGVDKAGNIVASLKRGLAHNHSAGAEVHVVVHAENHRKRDSHGQNFRRPRRGDIHDDWTRKDLIDVNFGTGRLTGKCLRDQVCIGTLCTETHFIASQNESYYPWHDYTFDGVFGLGLEILSQGWPRSGNFSWMFNVIQRRLVKEHLFSIFLSDTEAGTSEVTFGEIKPERMASDLFWAPVTNRKTGYWEITIEDITIRLNKTGICKGCYVALDTGTSHMAGPTDIID
jgi:hypothetical protein